MSAAPGWARSVPAQDAAETVSLLQVVAYNLARGRRERQLTQDELGERLERLTGRPWSRATVSAAESAWFGRSHVKRVRQFDANEVAAFALALELPLLWFFLPPTHRPDGSPVEPGLPWISMDKGHRAQVPAMSSEFWRELIFRQSDPTDEDQVMARRLRREGMSPTTTQSNLREELSALLARLDIEQQSSEDS